MEHNIGYIQILGKDVGGLREQGVTSPAINTLQLQEWISLVFRASRGNYLLFNRQVLKDFFESESA